MYFECSICGNITDCGSLHYHICLDCLDLIEQLEMSYEKDFNFTGGVDDE